MSSFKSGDDVVMKSNGTKMSVIKVEAAADGEEMIWCEWLHDGNKRRDYFSPHSLELKSVALSRSKDLANRYSRKPGR